MPDADLWPRCCLAASQPAPSPVARPIKGPRSHLGDHPRSLQAASGRRSGEPLDLGVVDDEAEDGLAHILRLEGLAEGGIVHVRHGPLVALALVDVEEEVVGDRLLVDGEALRGGDSLDGKREGERARDCGLFGGEEGGEGVPRHQRAELLPRCCVPVERRRLRLPAALRVLRARPLLDHRRGDVHCDGGEQRLLCRLEGGAAGGERRLALESLLDKVAEGGRSEPARDLGGELVVQLGQRPVRSREAPPQLEQRLFSLCALHLPATQPQREADVRGALDERHLGPDLGRHPQRERLPRLEPGEQLLRRLASQLRLPEQPE
mmetsp:Transcript_20849/g.61748  ORF Transcript_20849/g.61748 Transcript_20849/m.61748 type:complete len:321 (+) Transcript_20849:78-1040(+)